MNSTLFDYYRFAQNFADFALSGKPSGNSGYFRFGPDVICYGQCSGAAPVLSSAHELYDALTEVAGNANALQLPFDPSEVVANLRYERYVRSSNGRRATVCSTPLLQDAYYLIRPLLWAAVRKYFQRILLSDWKKISFPAWPVDSTVEVLLERLLILLLKARSIKEVPFIWFWPNGASSCAIMTHDVEEVEGRDFSSRLMDVNDSYGIKASFQVVPEDRYPVPDSFLDEIRGRGFELNVHDLNHDGLLFRSREEFLLRAKRINAYGEQFGASGFRAGALYHNFDWYDALNFSYDMSVPSVGNLEPQRGGCCSVMPFFVGRILELPVTTTQDYTLFNILNQYSTGLWKRQMGRIRERHGLVSFIVHPDYLLQKRALDTYRSLLDHLVDLRSQGNTWFALPGEVDQWWRARSEMKLVSGENGWVVKGPGSDKAQVAYAVLDGDRLVYEFERPGKPIAPRGEEMCPSRMDGDGTALVRLREK
jgi:hypothetical protein